MPALGDTGRGGSGGEGWCSDLDRNMRVVGELSLCGVMGASLAGVLLNGEGARCWVEYFAGVLGGDLAGVIGPASRGVALRNGNLGEAGGL